MNAEWMSAPNYGWRYVREGDGLILGDVTPMSDGSYSAITEGRNLGRYYSESQAMQAVERYSRDADIVKAGAMEVWG
jgi:hypothetical protein